MEPLSTSRWNQRYCASLRRHFSADSRPTGSRCVRPARSGAPSSARRVNTLLRPPARPAEVSGAYTHAHNRKSVFSMRSSHPSHQRWPNLLLLVQVEQQFQEGSARTWLSPKSSTLWLYLSSASLVAHSLCNTHTKYLNDTFICPCKQIFVFYVFLD